MRRRQESLEEVKGMINVDEKNKEIGRSPSSLIATDDIYT
jgi:hypothetical protein